MAESKPTTKRTPKTKEKKGKLSNGREFIIKESELLLNYLELEITNYDNKTGEKLSKPYGQFFDDRALANFLRNNGRNAYKVTPIHLSDGGKKEVGKIVEQFKSELKKLTKTEIVRNKNLASIAFLESEIKRVEEVLK